MVFGHLASYDILYSKSSIFATLGFASVKLRFARHKDCSREPQESPKRAVRELLGSIWEPLGGPWGSLGGLGALLGGRLGSLGPFSKPKRAQHSSRRAQYNPRHWISKNLQKPMFFYGFCILRLPQDRPAPPPETSREVQESLGEASGSLIRV